MASKAQLSKQERRERAREEARRIREEQARRDKRNRMLLVGGVIGLLVVAAIVIVLIVLGGNRSGSDTASGGPAGADAQGGIPLSSALVAGEAGQGVRVDVYTDYTCSWCEVFEQEAAGLMEEMSATGEAQFWIHPVATRDGTGTFTGYSGLAVNASATVAEHAPESWYAFHTALFGPYSEAAAAAQSGQQVAEPGLAEIEAAGTAVGVPDDVVARFADAEFVDWTDATTRSFRASGAGGTPHVLVDGEHVANWLDGGLREAIEAAAG